MSCILQRGTIKHSSLKVTSCKRADFNFKIIYYHTSIRRYVQQTFKYVGVFTMAASLLRDFHRRYLISKYIHPEWLNSIQNIVKHSWCQLKWTGELKWTSMKETRMKAKGMLSPKVLRLERSISNIQTFLVSQFTDKPTLRTLSASQLRYLPIATLSIFSGTALWRLRTDAVQQTPTKQAKTSSAANR